MGKGIKGLFGGKEDEQDVVDTDSVGYQFGTLAVSYLMFIAILMTAWNTTISSSLSRINDLCYTVSASAPCMRSHVLAIHGYNIARTLLLAVVILTAIYFASQMLNILAEYTPGGLDILRGPMSCISCTTYTFRAIEPSTVTMHAAIVGIAFLMVVPMALGYISHSDLADPDILRRKLVYVTLVTPVYMFIAYTLCFIIRLWDAVM